MFAQQQYTMSVINLVLREEQSSVLKETTWSVAMKSQMIIYCAAPTNAGNKIKTGFPSLR